MKLTLDLLRVLVRTGVYLLLLMTVLAVGSLIVDFLRSTGDSLRCTVVECEEVVARRSDEKLAAKQRLDEAQLQYESHRETLEEERVRLERSRATAQESAADFEARLFEAQGDAQQQMKRLVDAGRVARALQSSGLRTLNEEAVERMFELPEPRADLLPWTEAQSIELRNSRFMAMCRELIQWPESDCGNILAESRGAGLEPAHRRWRESMADALNQRCGLPFIGDRIPIRLQCIVRRDALVMLLPGIVGWAEAADRVMALSTAASSATDEAALAREQLLLLRDDPRYERELRQARDAHETADAALEEAQALLQAARTDPAQMLRAVRDRYWGFVRPFVWTALVVLLLHYFYRPLVYFVLAPWIVLLGRVRILRPAPDTVAVQEDELHAHSHSPSKAAELHAIAGVRQMNVELGPEDTLWVLPDYVVSSYQGAATWIWGGWKHPFSSYAAGLHNMTRFDGHSRAKVTIGNTGDGEGQQYMGCVHLTNHLGFVIRPRHMVAVQGDLSIKFYWSFRPSAWVRGQWRYVVMKGTGTVYVRGTGGVFPQALGRSAEGRRSEQPIDQLKDSLLIGWDASLDVGVRRNENWQYVALLRRDNMFETSLAGEGVYLQAQEEARRARDPVGRFLEAVLSTFGKLLGI